MYSVPIIFLAVSMGVSAPAPVQLTEKDFGQTVQLNAGGVMAVALGGNPTTGYAWTVAFIDRKILMQMGEATFEAERKARGSGGTVTMRFRAEGVGKTFLKLIYHRPFEKEKPPLKTFEVKVEIQ